MSETEHDDLLDRSSAATSEQRATRAAVETLVATKAVAHLLPPPSGDHSRFNASRLPIVERDSYEIAGEIAKGGIGRILRGRNVHLDRPVAIKELLDYGDAAEERFVCEALLTARLQHPSIVPVYEAGRWPSGEIFYAMKLVTGSSLADVLLSDTRSIDKRLALLPHVIAVAEAMAYAHSEGIIHRDLKPANILVGAFGETVVIDWGLAKDLRGDMAITAPPEPARELPDREPHDSGGGLTIAGAVMGTPTYMPPEQAAGRAVDERADVYAIGAILYHVLADRPPFEGKEPRAILRAVLEGPPAPIEDHAAGVPHELATILGKAMAREPSDRYRTARELAEDLDRFATGQIVRAHRYTRRELVMRFVRRYSAPLGVGVAAALALSVAISVGFARTSAARVHAEAAAAQAEIARAEATRRADDLTLVQAKTFAERDPSRSLDLLASLSTSFSRWGAARVIAADAAAHGIAGVLRGHTEAINDLALSPDGRFVVSTSDDHTARLWDLETGESEVLSGHADEVWIAAFSPDGKTLVTTSKDKTIRVWDMATRASRVLTGHEGSVVWVAWFPDGKRFATTSFDGALRLWDARSGESRELDKFSGVSRPLVISPDGKTLVVGALSGEIHVWDMEHEVIRHALKVPGSAFALALSPRSDRIAVRGYAGAVTLFDLATESRLVLREVTQPAGIEDGAVVFSPDGATLAFTTGGPAVVLLDLATGARRSLEVAEGHAGVIAFSPDGERLAAASTTSNITLWDLASGRSQVLRGFGDTPTVLRFSAGGRALVAASNDHTLRVFPVETEDGRVLAAGAARTYAGHFSPDGESLAVASADGTLRLWDTARISAEPLELPAHEGIIRALVWSPLGGLFATLGIDGKLRLWNRFGHLVREHASGAIGREVGGTVTFSPDGRLLAWSGVEGRVEVADVDSGAVRTLEGHTKVVWRLAFSPDGRTLASGAADNTVRLWSLDTGTSRELRGHDEFVSALAFSPDSKVLASGAFDHTMRLWDVESGASRTIDASGAGVEQIAFSPDGSTIYTLSSIESGVRAWDAKSGSARGLLRGHDGQVKDFALSPDGARMTTAGSDGSVRLWDLASGESRALRGHSGAVLDVSFTPDGRAVVSGGMDGSVRLWRDDLPTDTGAFQAWIRDVMRRPLPATPLPLRETGQRLTAPSARATGSRG